MPVIHQKFRAMFLRCDWKVFSHLDEFQILDTDLKTTRNTGSTLVFANAAGNDDGGLLTELTRDGKLVFREFFLEGHTLNKAAAIAQPDKLKLALIGAILHPTTHGDNLAFILVDMTYLNDRCHDPSSFEYHLQMWGGL